MEPQQKYCLGMVSNRWLGGGLNMFYWIQTLALSFCSGLAHFVRMTISNKAYTESEMKARQKQRIVIARDPYGVKYHHWKTGAKEKHQVNPDWSSNKYDLFQS